MKDGGPAFPKPDSMTTNRIEDPQWNIHSASGMSLRDYAIVHFTAALLPDFYTRGEKWVDNIAREQADAMLTEREKDSHEKHQGG